MKIKQAALTKMAYLEGLTEKNSPFIANQYVRWIYTSQDNTLLWVINTSTYQLCIRMPSEDIVEPHDYDFDIGLNTTKLFAVIKNIHGGDDSKKASFVLEDGNARIKYNSSNILVPTIIGLELAEVNEINPTKYRQHATVSPAILNDIGKLTNFTTTDNTAFTGIMLHFKDGAFEMYSSNRNAVYHILNQVDGVTATDISILPKTFVVAVDKLNIDSNAKIKIGKLSDGELYVMAWINEDGRTGYISSRKLEFAVPNLTRALAIEVAHTFVVNKNDFLDSVKLYEVMTELNSITFELSSEALLINNLAMSKSIPIENSDSLATIDTFKVTLGVKDVISILSTLEDELVQFSTDANANIVIFKEGTKTIVQSKMRRF